MSQSMKPTCGFVLAYTRCLPPHWLRLLLPHQNCAGELRYSPWFCLCWYRRVRKKEANRRERGVLAYVSFHNKIPQDWEAETKETDLLTVLQASRLRYWEVWFLQRSLLLVFRLLRSPSVLMASSLCMCPPGLPVCVLMLASYYNTSQTGFGVSFEQPF